VGDREYARFLDYELDTVSGELTRKGTVVPLERQPSRALALLVANRGRLVTRERLRRDIWPGDVHVDFDGSLNYCIRQVRAALGDDARSPRFIETVPRQGYRFIAPVSAPALTRFSIDVALPAPCDEPPRSRRGSRLWTSGAAAIVVLTGLLLAPGLTSHAPPRSNPVHHRAAVTLVGATHDLMFGAGRTGTAHHLAMRRITSAVHDLLF
jgi:DNA-binding winged helix-turn-helix (wHTH) protein